MSDSPESFSVLRKILPFTSVAIVILALYVGWTFYSRWNDEREAVRARDAREAEAARQTVDMLGGGKFKILNFYAVPGVVRRGQPTTICFGVSGAKSVHIDPEIEPIKPVISHCLQATPKKTTTYTLTAEDGAGHTATESFELKVVR